MPPFLPRKRLRSLSPSPGPSDSKGKGRVVATPPRKPTLFDALDAHTASKSSAELTKKLFANIVGTDDDDSELSSLSESEPEFEDVPKPKRQRLTHASDDEEDEDIEFEDVPTTTGPASAISAPLPTGDLELTLTKETRISLTNPYNKKQGPTKIERQIRMSSHCMHVQTLMWHNAIRNSWVCDKEVQQLLVKQLSPSMLEVIEKWKLDSGLKNRDPEHSNAKGSRKKKGKKIDERSQRDWGEPAQRLEGAKVNMSHGDPLFRLMGLLSRYWRQRFRVTAPGLRKTGYMSLPVLDEELKSFEEDRHDPERHGERLRNIEEFRARAKSCEGSRDLGAQLFVALLRGIGLDARMVASLQPVGFGWSKNEDATERKEKKSADSKILESDDSDDTTSEESEEEVASGKGKGKAKARNTHKGDAAKSSKASTRPKGGKDAPIDVSDYEAAIDDDDESVVDVTPVTPRRGPSKVYERGLPPNYWTEVLSPVTNTYVPVDPLVAGEPVASNEKILENFIPKGAKSEKAKQVMAYIIGFSADGTAKDVTVRYLKRHMWPGKTKGFRMPIEKVPVYNRKGKVSRYEEFDWFKTVMSGYTRRTAKRTDVDDYEEATDLQAVKPEKKEVKEGDETLQTYKSSAEFVLERHLRREEALLPKAKHVKLFIVKGKKGEPSTEEKVFLRKDVVPCKSIETWHKVGREPKIGEHPLKRVPYRAATTNRKRELAEAEALNGQKMLQGLYSEKQTDWIIPPPIENGVIPKNAYGNMDVYTPSMVPVGAVHIPRRGTMKICKKLGIDFAEAVTGFEFGARMAIPIITGVVVAEENEEMVLEQWRIDEAERLRKEDEKRTKTALGTWRKFLMGMRIVERVKDDYGEHADDNVDELNPWINKKSQGKKADLIEDEAQRRIMEQHDEDMGGGFFPDGYDVEEPAQSFFPVAQADEDEDEDEGGFILEGHEPVTTPQVINGAIAHATPTSMKSNEAVQEAVGDSDDDQLYEPQPSSRNKKRASITMLQTASANKKPTPPRRKSKVIVKDAPVKKAPAANGKAKRKLVIEDEQEEEGSSLSDPESDSSEEEAPVPKSRRRATLPVKTPQRVVPRRGAARKSERAVRSHYFEHSDDNDDNDDD